jgi:hypothetical protein
VEHTIKTRLSEINWANLKAGDVVRVPYRKEPYRERLVLSARAPNTNPIKIIGLPGPNGEKPHICGTNATTDPQFRVGYAPMETLGLIQIYWLAGQPFGTRPGGWWIEGFQISGATYDQPDRSLKGAMGNAIQWSTDSSGIYSALGDGLTVKNCDIFNNGNGIFTADANETTDVLIEGNTFFDNGRAGANNYLCHSTYIQAAKVVYRNNHYQSLRATSPGGGLKDRSADVLIEGNRIEGGKRFIDLSSWQADTTLRKALPNARRVIVRNNILDMRVGDSIGFVYIEEGRGEGVDLELLNNTFVSIRDQSESYYVRVIWSESTQSEVVKATGNIFASMPLTAGKPRSDLRIFDVGPKCRMTLGPNWTTGFNLYNSTGKVTGMEKVVGSGDPGFVDAAGGNFQLRENAPAKGFGSDGKGVPKPLPAKPTQ